MTDRGREPAPEIVQAITHAIIAGGLSDHVEAARRDGRGEDHRALVMACASQRREARRLLGAFVARLGVG